MGMIEANKKFNEWASDPANFQRINIPKDLLQVFVPQTLLSHTRNPEAVRVIPDPEVGLRTDALKFYTLERFDYDISDPVEFAALVENEKVYGTEARKWPYPNIDPSHFDYSDEIHNKIIPVTLADMVYIIGHLSSCKDKLEVVSFGVHDNLQKAGIGIEFYRNLEYIARTLGFRYIFGINDKDNIDFFIRKLKRIPYDQLSDDLKEVFHEEKEEADFMKGLLTVRIL